MLSDRVQRHIDRLLDEADEAIALQQWEDLRATCETLLSLDPDNADAARYMKLANDSLATGSVSNTPVVEDHIPAIDEVFVRSEARERIQPAVPTPLGFKPTSGGLSSELPEVKNPTNSFRSMPQLWLGVGLISVSLAINVALVSAGLTVYLTSIIGLAIWGALLFGIFLVGRQVYWKFVDSGSNKNDDLVHRTTQISTQEPFDSLVGMPSELVLMALLAGFGILIFMVVIVVLT